MASCCYEFVEDFCPGKKEKKQDPAVRVGNY